ncbi:hypothetical protein JCM11491_005325 [Sporobolomyces phaffii]
MTTFFDQLAQLATSVLSGLFPPATLASGNKTSTSLGPARAPCRAAIRTPAPGGTRQPRVGFFDPMPARPLSSPRGKRLSFSNGSDASSRSSAPVPSPPRRSRGNNNLIRALQAERNALGLSLDRPRKSCFRQCRANETFGIPSTRPRPGRRSSSVSFDRRVVFANPIDDGGDSPRHPSVAGAVADVELESMSELRDKVVVALALARTVRPRVADPYHRRAGPRRDVVVASVSVDDARPSSPPLVARSRLRTPPMAGARRRTVAYSF